MSLKNEINLYWSNRAEGYSQVNKEELSGSQKENWSKVLIENIKSHYGNKANNEIKILDVGTGPGFFAIIMAKAGFNVTAVDFTEDMLLKAKENAGELKNKIRFIQMDGQKLDFKDNSFDVVISRNLTWVLEKPENAYSEWCRVLKKDGLLLNFDANWYGYLYDEDKRNAYEQDRLNVKKKGCDDHYICTDIDTMESIAKRVPLSRTSRPMWDFEVLNKLQLKSIETDMNIWRSVWSAVEKVNYGSTPMFMVKAVK